MQAPLTKRHIERIVEFLTDNPKGIIRLTSEEASYNIVIRNDPTTGNIVAIREEKQS